jgi:cysteinyl-tRNA synthetase
MNLTIHNTLTGQKDIFEPLTPGQIRMYVCGVTPYDDCHLGHARCYVAFDFIRRSLKRLGYAVTCVQNFTDIDDKIIKRAKEKGEEPGALAERYIAEYFDKMDRLNVLRADSYPRVTRHIPQIVAFIERLVKNDMAYALDGDVYYAVRKFPPYGRLSKRSLDDLKAGARVEVDERKRDPLDFALWKAAKPGEPAWESPWGPGRPGWHIECSVMSLETLKTDTFDIHGGGLDLVFPHHENEIAQSEGATGRTFARYWIHNGFVTVNKEKMSKSLGNFFTLSEIFAKFEPRAVRFALLGQHYRTPLEFSPDLLEAAGATLKNLEETFQRLEAVLRSQYGTDRQDDKVLDDIYRKFEHEFPAALADDFNSPQALAALFDLLGALNTRTATHKSLSTPALEKGIRLAIEAFRDVFGIEFAGAVAAGGDADIDTLVNEREKARKAKNWSEADRLRKELTDRGVVVEDTPQGPRWWKKT